MFEFVDELLNSKDNIIDQLLVLKENNKNKEVKKYIKVLMQENLSPYYMYCINKYYFDLDVSEVKPPLPKLVCTYGIKKKVIKLLDLGDNIINQLIILRKHKNDRAVNDYIENYLSFEPSDYVCYCINKYFYDLDVEEVKPNAKNLRIKLMKVYIPSLVKKQERKREKEYRKSIKKAKCGDVVKITEGPFSGMCGVLESFDKETKNMVVNLEIFGEKISCECSDAFVIVKGVKNEKKN